MGWWSERVVPRMADKSLSSRPIMALRRDVCTGLSGRVLDSVDAAELTAALGATVADVTEPR